MVCGNPVAFAHRARDSTLKKRLWFTGRRRTWAVLSPEMEIFLNGESSEIPAGTTVSSLLETLGLEPARVAVELDRAILDRREWPKRILHPGARLEIVHFVGGG